jgi:membrane protease YdiL (CAAX protease family)
VAGVDRRARDQRAGVQIVITPTLLALLGGEPGDVASQVAELVANACTILVVALWVVRYERRAFRSVRFRGAGVGEFLGGFVGGVALFSVPMLAAIVLGYYELGGSEHAETGVAALLPVLLLIPVWFVQGTGEEVVTRGYLLQRHGVALPAWPAILIVSIGFSSFTWRSIRSC